MIMIRVEKIYSENELTGLKIHGHSNSNSSGKDLICAGVSSIVTGGFNALDSSEVEEVALEEGYAEVKLIPDAKKSKIVLEVILVQLETIAESYPQFIRIK